jgi:hypothetical protein
MKIIIIIILLIILFYNKKIEKFTEITNNNDIIINNNNNNDNNDIIIKNNNNDILFIAKTENEIDWDLIYNKHGYNDYYIIYPKIYINPFPSLKQTPFYIIIILKNIREKRD